MANNKDFKVKNGIQPTAYHEAVCTVVSGAEGYYLSGATYANKSFDPASQDTNPFDVVLNNDGTKMYVLTFNQKRVYQYSLSTAYDISTASYDNKSFLFTGEDALPWSIKFNNTGTKLFMQGSTNDNVFQYSLSTAFDVSTMSYDNVSYSYPSGWNARYLTFNSDGTKFYIVDTVNQYIYQHSMSTPFDLSTASVDAGNFADVNVQVAAAESMAFNADGTKMFVGDLTTDSIYQYSLSTPYDMSSRSYDNISFSVASEDGVPRSVFFADNGTKMYIAGQTTDMIYQYTTEFPTATLDLSTGSVFEVTPTSDIQINLSNPADSGTVSQATLLLDQAGYGGYDLSNAVYDSVSFDVSSEETLLQAVEFKTDGTKMYIIGVVGDDINQYSLSTAWDISTASYEKKTSGLADSTPAGLAFKSDGTKVYIVGYSTDTVYEYTLSTAWDLATISASASASFSVSTQDGTPTALTFKSDGSAMYVLGNANDNVYQYTLSTSWDLSTASYASKTFSFSSQENQVQGMTFKPDGSELYVVGYANDTAYKYSLSTAWDVSTASYTGISFSVATQEINPSAIVFKDDGTKMYIGGLTNAVYQYSTATPATITYDTAIEWPAGTAPTSPAIGDTDVITFSTRDGGSTYQAVQAIDGAK